MVTQLINNRNGFTPSAVGLPPRADEIGKKIYNSCDGTQRMKGGDTMRNGLYMFRHGKRLSQSEIAAKIGCSRQTYSSIETGARNGTMNFWNKLKAAFNISDAEIGGLMRIDEITPKNDRETD